MTCTQSELPVEVRDRIEAIRRSFEPPATSQRLKELSEQIEDVLFEYELWYKVLLFFDGPPGHKIFPVLFFHECPAPMCHWRTNRRERSSTRRAGYERDRTTP